MKWEKWGVKDSPVYSSAKVCRALPIGQWGDPRFHLEEIGKRRLVVETQFEGNLIDRLFRGLQLNTDFIVEEVREIAVNRVARHLLDGA